MSRRSPSSTTAMPAESEPRYSRRLRPSMRTGTTSRSAIAPTMPHMDGELLLGTDDCKRRAETGLAGAPHGRDGSPAKPSRPWGAPTRTWNHGESVRADAAGVRADGVRGRESTLDQRLAIGTHIAPCNHMKPSAIQTQSMDHRPLIRPPSAQDPAVYPTPR